MVIVHLDPPGFPVAYERVSVGLTFRCRLDGDVFVTDERGLPVLKHPELGAIVVCYRCAMDLGSLR